MRYMISVGVSLTTVPNCGRQPPCLSSPWLLHIADTQKTWVRTWTEVFSIQKKYVMYHKAKKVG